uniref:CRAL-TRIO domain-containing protein n=1 Tax=Caenorhabditis japonica TaxID=281687 RepID=A0A8R1E3M8_CAEJA
MPARNPFGQPLSDDAKRMVNEVRSNICQPIHSNFNTEFNVYRFIMAAERSHKKKDDIIKHATSALNNHLRYRKALNLDTENIPSFDENPIFQKKLMPRGEILSKTDSKNRLLWYIEYATITVESIAHSIRGSEACKYQFLQFEYMLRKVMEQEERTGRLSSLRHVVDMNGYEINPFTMLFVSSGTLAYYSQLFHFENYPELVTPVDMVNIAKWIHVPYRLAKTMMPSGFSEKFRLHDKHFKSTLLEEIQIDDIPTSLGGKDASIKFTDAVKVDPSQYWSVENPDIVASLEGFHVGTRKHKNIVFDVTNAADLKWYFSTDGDIYFGIFYEGNITNNNTESGVNLDNMEMVYPWLKIAARLVHEQDELSLNRPGRYHIIFCNNHSWLSRRAVQFYAQIFDHSDKSCRRLHSDGTSTAAEKLL